MFPIRTLPERLANPMRAISNHSPSTFEDRGAAVAFTTPLLAQTRVRRGERNQLEVLVPGLAEGRSLYVIPWRALPLAFPMTVHDRMLQDLIATGNGCSPEDIRKAVLEAAKAGLAGIEAVEQAEATLNADAEQRMLINFQLIAAMLQAVGLDTADLLRGGLTSAEGQAATRVMMGRAAQRLALEPQQLYANVAGLATVLEPIGMAPGGASRNARPGRLRRLAAELEDFRRSILDWATGNVSEAAPIAIFCGEVAEHTLILVRQVLSDIDQSVAGFEALLREWDRASGSLRQGATRLSWLVDGWEFVISSWRAARDRDRYAQDMTVHEIFRVLPLLPREETSDNHAVMADHIMSSNRRSVRAYVDWRSGQLDVDLVARIESIKARTAA